MMARWIALIYIALTALFASAGVAQAGPVFFAALSGGAGFAAAAAATSVGSFFTSTILGRLLGSVALSLLQGALVAKPKTPGITTEFTQNGGVNPCAFTLGKYATAGDYVCPPMTHGKVGKTPNAYLTYVIELSDIAGQTLSRVLLDGSYVSFTGAVHADYGTAAVGRLAGYAWLKYYNGTQVAADPMLISKYGAYPERPWLSDMVGTGMCYAILTFRYNRTLYQAYPQCRFEMGGIKLYDPRFDTTVGGSGAQRWVTPATWATSDNPMVMTYNIKRGITLPGLGIWGGNATAEDLPLASWFAAMNACDVATPLAAGGTEPAWRAGYEVTVDKEPAAVIEELLKTCAGQVAEVGGQWKARVGGAGLPVYFMTDADIITTKPQDYDPFPTSDQRMNGIDAQYPDPTEGWDPKAAPSRYNATWEAEDGGKRRVAALDLPACPYPNQVQRVMTGYIADERKFRRHNMTLPPDAVIIEPLDVISWTSARNGYASKLFDVAQMVDDVRRLNQGVAVREVDAADFSWSSGSELAVSYASDAVVTIPAQTVEGFDLLANTVTDGTGANRRAGLRLTWNGAEQDAVSALEYEVRVAATGLLIKRGTITDVTAGELFVADGILPATTYEARMRPVAAHPTSWTAWDSVTTASVALGQIDLDGRKLEAGVVGPVNIPATVGHVFLTLAMGPSLPNQVWQRGMAFWAKVTGAGTVTLTLERRYKENGTWGTWSDWANYTLTTTWDQYTSSNTLAGVYDDVEMRLVVLVNGSVRVNDLKELYMTFGNIVA